MWSARRARLQVQLWTLGPGVRVSTGRHYFNYGGTILALWDALADGDAAYVDPNPAPIYLSTDELPDAVQQRAFAAGARPDAQRGDVGI